MHEKKPDEVLTAFELWTADVRDCLQNIRRKEESPPYSPTPSSSSRLPPDSLSPSSLKERTGMSHARKSGVFEALRHSCQWWENWAKEHAVDGGAVLLAQLEDFTEELSEFGEEQGVA